MWLLVLTKLALALVSIAVLLGVTSLLLPTWMPRKRALWTSALLLMGGAYALWAPEDPFNSIGESAPRSAVLPYKTTACEALTQNYGWWAPAQEVMRDTVHLAAKTACYNYFTFDPKRFSKTFEGCAQHLKTGTVRLHIELPEDSSCQLEICAASHANRTWVRLESLYVRGGQVGNQIDIFEIIHGKPTLYTRYWQCEASRESAMQSSVPPGNADGHSKQMLDDWPAHPPPLRGFLCTGELGIDQPSQP